MRTDKKEGEQEAKWQSKDMLSELNLIESNQVWIIFALPARHLYIPLHMYFIQILAE